MMRHTINYRKKSAGSRKRSESGTCNRRWFCRGTEPSGISEQYPSEIRNHHCRADPSAELNYKVLAPIDKERPELPEDVCEQVEINIKYDGYIRRQMKQVEQFKKLEQKKLPEDIDYEDVGSLRIEARQKLEAYRPVSIGQASRISGVSPADISVLLVYLESRSGHKHG